MEGLRLWAGGADRESEPSGETGKLSRFGLRGSGTAMGTAAGTETGNVAGEEEYKCW